MTWFHGNASHVQNSAHICDSLYVPEKATSSSSSPWHAATRCVSAPHFGLGLHSEGHDTNAVAIRLAPCPT